MESVAVSSSEHETTCKFVNYNYFAVSYDIVYITLHHVTCFQRLKNVMVYFHVFRIGEVFDTEVFFALFYTGIGKCYLLILLFDSEIVIFAFLKCPYESVCPLIHIGRLIASSRNDERSSGFVDEDGVNFVYDGIIQFSLHHVIFVYYHVVSQIVETVLVISSVSDVCLIGCSSFFF